ncbi:MAG: ABC transporter permease subunit [Myxococcaceae bacterium]|nr:ABC transporter permease subunit [Myxococcaceae bacterium]
MLTGFRESRRNRVTVVVGLFAFVMIFSATFVLELTVTTFERVMNDVGLGMMSLISVFLAIFLASGLLPREIERRTIFLIVSKPVSRSAFLVGRLLGNVMTVGFVVLTMAGLFALQTFSQGGAPSTAALVAIAGLMLEVILLSCIGFAFASWSSQFVAAVATVGLYFTGHLASDLYLRATKAKLEVMKTVGLALYYALPNLDRLDYRARATYGIETPLAELGSSALYTLGYSAVVVVIACVLFERRDFR